MPLNRRELLQATGSAVGAAFAADKLAAAQAATGDDFSIENVFADFMRDIGGSAEDAGGRVLFTGRDPILRSDGGRPVNPNSDHLVRACQRNG